MKQIILTFLVGIFICLSTEKTFALIAQTDTTTAVPDDLDFTTVGSKEDSVANGRK